MAKDIPRGLPGLRSAKRVAGVNAGRIFGEGDGGAVHNRSDEESVRENENQGETSEPSTDPGCIAEVMARGSSRTYTPGGRKPIDFSPGPGNYAEAERGVGPLPDERVPPKKPRQMTVEEMMGPPPNLGQGQGKWDKYGSGERETRDPKRDRNSGTKPPV
jgi:hypothetical protein